MEPPRWVVSGQAHTQDPHVTGDAPVLQLLSQVWKKKRIESLMVLTGGGGSVAGSSRKLCLQMSPGHPDVKNISRRLQSLALCGKLGSRIHRLCRGTSLMC